MKAWWYVLTVLIVAFGALKLFRVFQKLSAGGGISSVATDLGVAVLMLVFAWKAVGNARSSSATQPN
jgi:hypothetical protein